MRTAAITLAYAAALAFGLAATFTPTLTSRFAQTQTERGDGMLNHYILEHTWQSLTNPDYRGSFFSPPCFYPEPYTLWYSEHFLGVAPVYWALRLALPYDLAFQWWQIILEGLNFVAFAAVLRWLRAPHVLAILGGYLWAFGLVHLFQIAHQQMIPRFCMALAAYHAWMFVLSLGEGETPAGSERPPDPARHLNRMCAAVFVQGITCVNTGWFLVTGLGTFLPLALSLRRGGWRDLFAFLRRHRGRAALIVGGWTAALVLAYVPYFVVNWGLSRGYDESIGLMPTPSAWITGAPGNVWNKITAPIRQPVSTECWLFCGFTLYALALAAGVHSLINSFGARARPEFGLVAAGLLTAVVWVGFTITFEDGGHSLWEYVRYIPGGTAIRCVSRVYVCVYLFGTLAAFVWLARVTESLPPPTQTLVLGLVTFACLAEQLGYKPGSFDKRDFYALADRLSGELKKGDIAYIVPRYTDTKGTKFTLETVHGEVFAMWVGLKANVPVVNGYSGRLPGGDIYPGYREPVTEPALRKWLAGRFHGKVAIVDPENPNATFVIQIE